MVENGKRNGVIAGGGAALVVVLGLVFGMVRSQVQPQIQSIEFMERRITELKEELSKIDQYVRGNERTLSAIGVQFAEVETQFDAAAALTEERLNAVLERLDRQDRDGNPRHDERIRNLEKVNGIER